MEKTPLNQTLRNFIISSSISLPIIKFDESEIKENQNYQVLVLEKPDEIALEIEEVKWPFEAEKVLFVWNCKSNIGAYIPTEFSFQLNGREKEDHFGFSSSLSFKIVDDHIMLIANGRFLHGESGRCNDIAIFTTAGKLVAIWQMDTTNVHKVYIIDFHKIKNDHWLANFDLKYGGNEGTKNRLCLLFKNRFAADTLSLRQIQYSETGALLGSRTSEISNWFSEEIDGTSMFFVLASHYQCCIYQSYSAEFDLKVMPEVAGEYKKIADLKFDHMKAFIRSIHVEMKVETIVVTFNDKSEFGSFVFNYK